MKLMGYKRENGTYGIRNHLLVIPTSVCAADTASKIANLVPNSVSLPNQHGCCQIGSAMELTENTLLGFALNPNVGAVLVVGLGCDGIQAKRLAEKIKAHKNMVDYIVIQENEGTIKSIYKGVEILRRYAEELSQQTRKHLIWNI